VGGQLQARLQKDQQPLRDALVGATQRGLRRLLQLGDSQGPGRQRISVAVVPLPALGVDEQPGAVVLLGKRQVCEELTVEWFARSHGLTMAETTVIKGLCADLTPHEIAARQGVGLATIRTQIGSIRIKTGSRQHPRPGAAGGAAAAAGQRAAGQRRHPPGRPRAALLNGRRAMHRHRWEIGPGRRVAFCHRCGGRPAVQA
jgi:DNA-binding CsgD family transcriptional regulator